MLGSGPAASPDLSGWFVLKETPFSRFEPRNVANSNGAVQAVKAAEALQRVAHEALAHGACPCALHHFWHNLTRSNAPA